MQSGSTVLHASVHVPSLCVLQQAVSAMLHSSPVPHPSCLLLQSEQLHPSLLLQVLSLLQVDMVVPHASQFIAHLPLLHRCVPSGQLVAVRSQLYSQVFLHASLLFVFPSSQSSPKSTSPFGHLAVQFCSQGLKLYRFRCMFRLFVCCSRLPEAMLLLSILVLFRNCLVRCRSLHSRILHCFRNYYHNRILEAIRTLHSFYCMFRLRKELCPVCMVVLGRILFGSCCCIRLDCYYFHHRILLLRLCFRLRILHNQDPLHNIDHHTRHFAVCCSMRPQEYQASKQVRFCSCPVFLRSPGSCILLRLCTVHSEFLRRIKLALFRIHSSLCCIFR